jgi:hypothetical protein
VPRSRRGRLAIAVIGGVLALLCLGGVGITFVLYDDATKIDRGSPDVAVDNLLRAYLVDRDDQQSALYACDSAGVGGLVALRSEIVDREKEFDVTVSVTWSSLTVENIDPTHSSVETGLVIAGSAKGQALSRRTERWKFEVVDNNGWRVCGAAEVL